MRISRFLVAACAACLLVLSLIPPVMAGQLRANPVAVVELFTSQGCSSCPPADALLAELDGREDVIALAYHVDYWDYIGWPDTFGSAAFSDHQRAYARGFGESRVYTPQMIVNGRTDVVGSRRSEVEQAIRAAELPLTIEVSRSDNMFELMVPAAPDHAESTIWLVTYKNEAEVAIERGENRGRTITYAQIVTDRQVLGMWDPRNGVHLKLPMEDVLGSEYDGCAILIQANNGGEPGPILGAVSLEM